MLGNNPIRQPLNNSGRELEVKEIYRTLQGEGPYTGRPAVFIRLGGCNLACSFCDTEFEDFGLKRLEEIISEVKELAIINSERVHNLVVITGGEPLRQPIKQLCDSLLDEEFLVQIETNGTLYRELDPRVHIVCSPKNQGIGYNPIRKDLLKNVSAIKFVISASNNNYGDIAEVGQSEFNIPVYVQPMDELDKKKNQENLRLAISIAEKRGCTLSLQTHKLIGIP